MFLAALNSFLSTGSKKKNCIDKNWKKKKKIELGGFKHGWLNEDKQIAVSV